MTVEYQVIFRCACGEHRVYADYDCPVSDTTAREDLLKAGWKHTGGFEYTCPQCQRENDMNGHIPLAPMTPADREAWLQAQAAAMSQALKDKYRAGQVEHKGDLGEVSGMQLLNEMEAEALDQLSYIRELKRRLTIQ